MNINYLRKTEIIYELLIRGFEAADNTDVSDLKFILRKFINDKKPILQNVQNSLNKTAQKEVAESLAEVEKNLASFPGKDAKISKRKILSRLTHISDRLKRYKIFENDDMTKFVNESLNRCELIEAKLSRTVQELTKAMSSTFIEGTNGEPLSVESDASDSEDCNPETSTATKNFAIIPVCKWDLKFNGQGNSEDVLNFIERVEELRVARGVSKDDLFRSAIDLFSGAAMSWFRSIKNKVSNWDSVINRLKMDFLPEDYDEYIWAQLHNRKQGRNERVLLFIGGMENLFSKLNEKAAESKMIKLIKKNLLPIYNVHLSLIEINSISELMSLCRKIENANQSQLSLDMISHSEPVCSVSSDNAQANAAYGLLLEKIKLLEQKFEKYNEKPSTETQKNVPRPIFAGECWKCHSAGHKYSECKISKKSLFCFGCGKEGVSKLQCPKCSKN